jgi:hypothetical protein
MEGNVTQTVLSDEIVFRIHFNNKTESATSVYNY